MQGNKNNQLKIVLPGGAGLVGQNLVARLIAKGYTNLVVIDKHQTNLNSLKKIHPEVVIDFADISRPGDWQHHFLDAEMVVMLQAQIGGLFYQDFIDNNVSSTKLILDLVKEKRVNICCSLSGFTIRQARGRKGQIPRSNCHSVFLVQGIQFRVHQI